MASTVNSTRRLALKIGMTFPLIALPSIVFSRGYDPLLNLITEYRKGLEDVNSDDYCDAHHSEITHRLNDWTGPAPSKESAVAALLLARDENSQFSDSPTAHAMIQAAILYIEDGK